jgi:hypothetical protein
MAMDRSTPPELPMAKISQLPSNDVKGQTPSTPSAGGAGAGGAGGPIVPKKTKTPALTVCTRARGLILQMLRQIKTSPLPETIFNNVPSLKKILKSLCKREMDRI